MPPLPLSPQVFAILRYLVEERTGLHYEPDDIDLFGDKVSERAAACGFDSLLEYYYFLRYDPGSEAEVDALINALVVGESYLYREADQLRALIDQLAPRLAAGHKARVWSAACASGEEPLTLALMLSERGLAESVEIVASDISSRALERARRGELGRRSLRALPPAWSRFFRTDDQGCVRVDPALLSRIQWRRCNLVDGAEVNSMGRFDAILCRNVLIYFSDETCQRVVELLHGALAPGGYLLVGASESLLRFGTLLTCHERGGAFVYRKEPA